MVTWDNEKRAEYAREQCAAAKADRTCDNCGASVAHMRSDARWCSKPCANAGVKRERIARGVPEWRADASSTFRYRLRKYGLVPEDFDRMVEEQDGKCAICMREFDLSGPTRKDVVVDHDHTTGEVRGLLCQHCNVGIGMLGDDADRIMSAAAYLLARQDVLVGGGFA